MNDDRVLPSLLLTLSLAFRLCVNILGAFGLFLVAYEVCSLLSGSRWAFLDGAGPFVSAISTIVGTACTAISVYFFAGRVVPPEKISIFVTAPLVLLGCVVALYYLLYFGQLPSHVVNGLALL